MSANEKSDEPGDNENEADIEQESEPLTTQPPIDDSPADAPSRGESGRDQSPPEQQDNNDEDHYSGEEVMDIDLNFEDMELEFQGVLEELSQDPTLARFRMEYSKLHAALQRSHHNERRLMDKCRELQAEIASHSAEVATALKLASDDKQTIDALKKEVEKAWKMVDLAHEREQEAKETMEALQNEITRLHELSGQGEALMAGRQDAVSELSGARDELQKERDGLLHDVAQMRSQLETVNAKQDAVEAQRLELETKLESANAELQVHRGDMQREIRRKERAERDLRAARAEIDAKEGEIRVLKGQLQQYEEQFGKSEAALKDQKANLEKTTKELEAMTQRAQKLRHDYEIQLMTADQLAQENQHKVTELKGREEEMAALRQEVARLGKLRDSLTRRLRAAEEQRSGLQAEMEASTATKHRLARDLEQGQRQADADKKTMDELRYERELLKKGMLKVQALSQKQQNLMKLHDQAKKTLESETNALKQSVMKKNFAISQLEKERDKYISESATLTQRVLSLMEAIKIKELEIFDYRKKMSEVESKLKQQQSLYEAVRSDRNLYSKNLIESQDEVSEMKRKLKILTHQIYQLKQETTTREALLIKEQNDLRRVSAEKEALQLDLEGHRVQAVAMKNKINEFESEHLKLNKVIANSEAERNKQRKDMNQIMTERDILGTQLVRRNDELALLYEKIRIQESTLSKGEQQYRERIKDIGLLKLEIKKLRREKSLLNRSVHNLEDMRREMYHMHRALLKERSKCNALENELQNPQNVHRWRRLEGSDPNTYEMILKIQTLQRRLIMKTEEATRKELEVQEKEKLYLSLKQILSRQPGPEVAEQLMLCQGSLRHKTRQMKSLVSELNMYESQMQEYKLDIDRLTTELKEIKKRYAMQKRQESRLRGQLQEVRVEDCPQSVPARDGDRRGPPRATSGRRLQAGTHRRRRQHLEGSTDGSRDCGLSDRDLNKYVANSGL
ncbi:cilia- and flagella-associated protein 58-like [Amphibalanus amphitrite]|uniref:cilia- and flagella-associated protein 58-like n=1 Tax=Amphibalanus amphitrite TaxID=1232801 RepID=UPI001C923D7A|nr:cilia- and flagella-associated protein 58-like [Amphibalanus amphitrite]